MRLKIDKCKDYETKYIRIPNSENNIIDFLKNKISCGLQGRTYLRSMKDGKIKNINDTFVAYSNDNHVYSSDEVFAPTIIDWTENKNNSDIINLYLKHSVVKGSSNNCALCDDNIYEIDTNKKLKSNYGVPNMQYITLNAISGSFHPTEDETFLIYKNFIIKNNLSPYMKNHLMLVSLDHETNKINGSQYEILNREFLENVVVFFSKIHTEYTMGHNYAHTGSQFHFHMHILEKQSGKNGLDKMLDDLMEHAKKKETDEIIHKINYEGTLNEYNYTCYNKKNQKTSFFKFKSKTYGYSGYLLGIPKGDFINSDKEYFIETLHKLLNTIESTILYTFNLYFGCSQKYINIVILPQKKTNVTSFRNITNYLFIAPKNNLFSKDSYKMQINALKYNIESYVDLSCFDDETIIKLLEYTTSGNSNIYGDTNLRHLISTTNNDTDIGRFTNNFINEIKNIPKMKEGESKMIIISSPIGSGKSLIKKNLKQYFDFYDPNSYVSINVDDIIMGIPKYKKITEGISNYLKTNFLNRELTDIDPDFYKFGTKKISDLSDDNFMTELSVNEYKLLLDYLKTLRIPLLENKVNKTILDIHDTIFEEINTARNKLLSHMISICIKNNLNIVVEFARREFSLLSGEFKIGTKYKIDNTYYIGYEIPNTDITKKFILRNILLRNIYEGRMIYSDTALDNLANAVIISNTYKSQLNSSNIRTITLTSELISNTLKNTNRNMLNRKFLCLEKIDMDYPTLSCVDDNETIDDKFVRINKDDIDFEMICFKNKLINMYEVEEMNNEKTKLKKMMTEINNKYLLNETVSTIMIKNIVHNINEIIKKLIPIFNEIKINDEPESDIITENDIKLILKGGIPIRLTINKALEYFKNMLNFDDNDSEKQKLKNLIDNIDKNTLDGNNAYANLTAKSDIDFTVLINGKKLQKGKYYYIREKLSIIIYSFLFDLKENIDQSNFYGMGYNYKNIDYDKTIFENIKTKYRSHQLIANAKLFNFNTFPENDDKILVVQKGKIFTDSRYLTNITEYFTSYSHVNIPYITQITDTIKSEIFSFKLMRLLNNYDVKKKGSESQNISGEIIDITILDYEQSKHQDFENIVTYEYTNNLFKFNFETLGLKSLVSDIENVLFHQAFYPWLNEKMNKRLNRYFMLLMLNHFNDYDTTKFTANIYDLFNFENTENVDVSSPFFAIVKHFKTLKQKIAIIKSNPLNYMDTLKIYGYDTSINIDEHYDICMQKYEEYKLIVIDSIKKTQELQLLLKKYANPKINEQIEELKNKKTNITQWGGYKSLHKDYKNYYLAMKGGQVNFQKISPNNNKILPFDITKPLTQPHIYTDTQQQYINYFFNTVLINVNYDGIPFSTTDVTNSKVMGCGSFGCSVLIENSGVGKKYIFKIIGGGYIANSLPNYDKNIPEYLEETLIGYHASQHNFPNFNKTYAYFKSSKIKTDTYFSSIDDKLTLSGGLTYSNQNDKISGKNIFILMIDAGTNSLNNLIQTMKNDLGDGIIINDVDTALKEITKIFKQMTNITKSAYFSKTSKRTLYLTHNDIKLPNMIFIKSDLNTYDMEFIDYGGCIFSQTFFTNIGVHTPYYMNLIYNTSVRFTSPLYDVGSVIYAMLEMFCAGHELTSISNHLNSYSNGLNINLNSINIALVNIYEILKSAINKKIFNGFLNVTQSQKINNFAKKLLIYVNLAGCIKRFTKKYKFEIENDDSNKYKTIDFRNFELVEFNSCDTISATYVKTYGDLSGYELLQKIMDEVNNNVEHLNC